MTKREKALEFINSCEQAEKSIIFPVGVQLEREVYNEVKMLLEGIYGKWNAKINGFSFKVPYQENLNKILNGEVVKIIQDFQFFETPSTIADRMVEEVSSTLELNNIEVLEPSAGMGAIISAVHRHNPNLVVDACELMPYNREHLSNMTNVNLLGENFLETEFHKQYDVILANPPFTNNQDIEHIYKMWDLLKLDGELVVITSTSWINGTSKKHTEFRRWLDDKCMYREELPANTFEKTNIKTMFLSICKNKTNHSFNADDLGISIINNYVEIKVPSTLYAFTTAAGSLTQAANMGWLSCGDGDNYKLTAKQKNYCLEQLKILDI